uniref:Proline rich mitotic checkpoint control factor n=1 Tax=Sphenodon punctatus TaxID=8508 RepID=A0A8D0G533_SPHPU
MSLVAYASSEEESETEEATGEGGEEAPPALPPPPGRGLFSSLPPPKPPLLPPMLPHQLLGGSGFPFPPPLHGGPPPPFPQGPPLPPGLRGFSIPPPGMGLPEPPGLGSSVGEQPRLGGLPLPPPRNSLAPSVLSLPPPIAAAPPGAGADLSFPKPKKRTEPVRITVPELQKGDSDSEEDEPEKKRKPLQGEGTGLSALLPQPKNLTVKESNRLLLPHAFSKKMVVAENAPESTPAKALISSSKPKPPSKPVLVATTPSPSAIKAAAKSAALQVTKQITQEDDDSDEDVEPENYFSLSDKSEPSMVSPPEAYVYTGTVVTEDPPPGTEPEPEFQDAAANAPLEFKTATGSSSTQHSWAPKPGEDYSPQPLNQYPGYNDGAYYQQDYYSSGYYQDTDTVGPTQEMNSEASFMDDEAFKRLQGKRNRGREEINFVEIKGDDQLSGAQQWMTKSLTEEQNMKSFSKKKGEQPTGQQRRKHQITYLIHQAKERELELKNTWAENKLSRRQTQAKYGF